MPSTTPDRIRNVAVVGHSHDGKTTLLEALLHTAGATPRLGSPDQRTSILDAEPEEQRRGVSITAAYAWCEWMGVHLNLVDTPGTPDFGGQVAEALAAVDGAVLCVAAAGTVPVGAELAIEQVRAAGVPTLIAVTKVDKENGAFEATVDALRDAFDRRPIAVAVPIGAAAGFRGFVDLVDDRAYEFEASGGGVHEIEIPSEMRDEVERAHTALVEAAVETDDALVERYLEGETLGDEEVRRALHTAALRGSLMPVVPVASPLEHGTAALLDCINRFLEAPVERTVVARDPSGREVEVACDPEGPLLAHVVRTVVDTFGRSSYVKVLRGTLRADAHLLNPRTGQEERVTQLARPMGGKNAPATEIGAGDIGVVIKLGGTRTGDTLCDRAAPLTLEPIAYPAPSYAATIGARTAGDEDKISTALSRQVEEDPTFSVDRDPLTHEIVAHGLGETHLDVAVERIKRRFGVDAVLTEPRVAYRETVRGSARVQHKHKKQSGGAGLYGDCTIEVEPMPRGEGFVWEEKIVGGSIPQQFRPSVEKGVRQTMEQGALTGHPVVDVRVRLVDGSTHPVDGKDIAFQIAGSMAMRKAILDAQPVLLEPVMSVVVTVPERLCGEVIGVINGHRGHVGGMNPLGDGHSEVNALVPQAEMYRFPIHLRATTQGRGRYRMQFSHYDEAPPQVVQPLVDAFRREHAAIAS